ARGARLAGPASALMCRRRQTRATAMRPCGPSPFSTVTKRRSMRVPPVLQRRYSAPMSKSIATIALERRVDALFTRYTKPGSPGAVVAVMRDGEIELCKGYGLASIELG